MTTTFQPDEVRGYPRFTSAEYARRHAAVEKLRVAADVDAVVVFGGGAARHEVQFLTAWPPRQEGWLVMSPGDEPALYVQLFNHVPTARDMAVVERVEWAGVDSATTVAAELQRRGSRRIGLVGAVSYQAHQRLLRAIDGAEIVDLTPAFRRMRLVKSAEEIEWTRRGAALCDVGLRALVAEARPGLREFELGSIVESAYGREGGQHGICFIATVPMSGGGRFVPAQTWSNRRVEAGDAILIELSAGIGGYTGQVLRTIAVGDVPAPYRALHDAADDAYRALVAAARPGATAADLLATAGRIDAAGWSVCDDVVHGYGGGYLAPVLRTPATAHGTHPDLVLESGMMLVVQPNVITTDASMGVQTGELVLITDGGATSMHDVQAGLLTAGSQV
jgi:Xaa-Pro aminopeptidase